ncbi:MAPK/MAK/MRK overlapping kinase [Microplitis demolitor]|uniref:MAPK/MAK/MRK overlapping kinase n=1 Tax=Microplitis demolitor TaxID=69319 RepID=UPI0004CCED5A|nr:MAPK/MAK/MRK overlapping kinase [Microplitis demolitor]
MSTSFFKKYKVVEKIGEGSFSEVLKCQDRATGIYYAGKKLKKIFTSMNEMLESPEVIVMRKITRHPNILHMIESHYNPMTGKVILIFELMDMSLYDLIKSRKSRVMSEQKIRFYLYQLLKGLEHLHKNGIFHRDIKPENILVKGDLVKLGDLGSIRGIYSKPPYTEYISTRWYRSPECLLTNGFYGPKMDVWAIGCVFYELLSLKPLFPGSNEIDQIAKIHAVLGTPHARIIAKFRRLNKSRDSEYSFPNKGTGSGFTSLLPHVSETGKELLRLMLIYDPENRSNVKRLLEHRYFNNLKECDTPRQASSFTLPSVDSCQWRNSVLSYITSEKRRRFKPLSTRRPKVPEDFSSRGSRIITSSPSRQNFISKSSISKLNTHIKEDTSLYLIHESKRTYEKTWRTCVYTTRTERCTESPRSNASVCKLPLIKNNNMFKMSGETGDAASKINRKNIQCTFTPQYNLRGRDFYPNFRQKLQVKDKSDDNRLSYLPQIAQKPVPERRQAAPTISAPQQNAVTEGGKRKTRLPTITETRVTLPHTRSSNIKSPAKKIAKHETTTKSLGKILPAKKTAPARRLRGKGV